MEDFAAYFHMFLQIQLFFYLILVFSCLQLSTKRYLITKLRSTQLQAQSQNKTKPMASKFLVQVDGDVVELDPQVVLSVYHQPTDHAIRMKVYPKPECLEDTRDLGSQETQDQEVASNVALCNSVHAATRKRKRSPEAN